MIITFCGHSNVYDSPEIENMIFDEIQEVAGGRDVTFYLGGYGQFDSIALRAAKKYKAQHAGSIVAFVTPYINETYLKNRSPLQNGYDEIVYPDIEQALKKFAILARNKFMIDRADFVIAFVEHHWGGAAKSLEYAKRKKKKFVNLYNQKA